VISLDYEKRIHKSVIECVFLFKEKLTTKLELFDVLLGVVVVVVELCAACRASTNFQFFVRKS
jgi:hypothetical protein